MGENTKIQWADHTFNPWRGCTKVAPGCASCYADAQSKRNPKTLGVWGPNGTRVVASESMWRQPAKWDREADQSIEAHGERVAELDIPAPPSRPDRPRVFCASLADVFEDWSGQCRMSDGGWCVQNRKWGKPTGYTSCRLAGGNDAVALDDVRARLCGTIDATRNLIWLLLSKRIENARRMLTIPANGRDPSDPLYMRRNNLWLGTSVACQEDADRNIPELLKCRDLCAKLFVSVEPFICPVDLSPWLVSRSGYFGNVAALEAGGKTYPKRDGVDWVIVGGESGPRARPCSVEWIRSIVRQCRDAGVPCFVKQLGSRAMMRRDSVEGRRAGDHPEREWPTGTRFSSSTELVGTEWHGHWAVLRDPKGGDQSEWPEDLRVREVPA